MFKYKLNRKPYNQAKMAASFESYLKMQNVTDEKEFWKVLNRDLLKLYQRRDATKLLKAGRVIWCLIKSAAELPAKPLRKKEVK